MLITITHSFYVTRPFDSLIVILMSDRLRHNDFLTLLIVCVRTIT